MTRISMRKLIRRGDTVLQKLQEGESFLITQDGRPIARLEPLEPDEDDPFYRLSDHAADSGYTLNNQQMDGIIYSD